MRRMAIPAVRRRVLTLLAGFGLSFLPRSALGRPDMKAFQAEVLAILRERYPDRHAEPAPEEDVILLGKMRLGIGNLAVYASDPDPAKRRKTIVAWLDQIVDPAHETPKDAWVDVLPKLRPKLMPADYLRELPSLVHRPFSEELRLAYGVDEGNRDRYVAASHLEGWGATSDTLHERAISNLEAMSQDVVLQKKTPRSGRGAYVTVNVGDAYDATRIVLPGFRTRLLATLGPKARVGIPNRDFLVAWSQDFGSETRFIERVEEDAHVQAYPLTKQIFVIEESGLRPL